MSTSAIPEWRKKGHADPHATFDTCPGFESWWDGMPQDNWYCKHCGGVLQKHKVPPLIEEPNAEEQARRHQSNPARQASVPRADDRHDHRDAGT